MLKNSEIVNQISDDLARLQVAVVNRGLLQRLDLHKSAESFFCGLFNLVYGFDLKNLNFIKPNHPAIDLGDPNASLGLQVTGTTDKVKVQNTLKTAFKHEVYKTFKQLKVFIIGSKLGSYTGLKIPTGIIFDPEADIFDVADLLREIEALDVPKLSEVANYLRSWLLPLDERLNGTGPTVQSHDRDMFYEANIVLDEAELMGLLSDLENDHSYRARDGSRPVWDFLHHFELESNRFISEELNTEADSLRTALLKLMNFVATNFFRMHGGSSEFQYLRPDWHEERGGDGSIKLSSTVNTRQQRTN